MGSDPALYDTRPLRRTKVALIYRQTVHLRAVQLLLGRAKLERTVRFLGIEVHDARPSRSRPKSDRGSGQPVQPPATHSGHTLRRLGRLGLTGNGRERNGRFRFEIKEKWTFEPANKVLHLIGEQGRIQQRDDTK